MSVVRRSVAAIDDRLGRLRQHETAAVLVGAAVGLGLSSGHYLGLVVGGVLVGLPARSTKRALVFGVGFGLLVWLAFAAWLAGNGALGAFTDMGRIALLNVGVSLGLPVLGALAARGLS